MKKIFLYVAFLSLILTGCGKYKDGEVLKEFKSLVESSKSYYLEGDMELINNEDVYSYDIKVSYEEGDYYKIELVNKINNHEQMILRNEEGVYVITPSLNKSFKFQSDWPYNNSQVYLLSSLIDDIENDEDRIFETTDDGYLFTSLVNYPNNEALVNQKVYLGNDFLPKRVEVLDKDGNAQIKMNFEKIDLKTEFNDTYFDLNSILNTEEELPEENNNTPNDSKDKEETENKEAQEPNNNTSESTEANNENSKETATIDDIIYPMYLPTGTYLTSEERVSTENGERLILTFGGESSFTLVEETISYSPRAEIIPTTGNVELIGASLAVINEKSANWFDNNISYSVYSSTMNTNDLLQVVKSISVLPVSK
ncbi:MAG: outer membrane lipoprotein carrier protein LolA [Bacilli bacterium]|nr:outer membrane lipoprotein carrier protein LolA [Bacilli bacterium]